MMKQVQYGSNLPDPTDMGSESGLREHEVEDRDSRPNKQKSPRQLPSTKI